MESEPGLAGVTVMLIDKGITEASTTGVRGQEWINKVKNTLTYLKDHHFTWGDIIEYISDPQHGKGQERWEGFFHSPRWVQQILNWWSSSRNSKTGCCTLQKWAVSYVAGAVEKEGHAATKNGLLQSCKMTVDELFAMGFYIKRLYSQLDAVCPTITRVLHAFSTTAKQRQNNKEGPIQRKVWRVGAALLLLLGERSQANSYSKHVIGLYLYATGAQRQVISVLNSLGICSSYPTLAGSRKLAHIGQETPVVQNRQADELLMAGSGVTVVLMGECQDPQAVELSGSDVSDSGESNKVESDTGSHGRALLELESEDIPLLSSIQHTSSTMIMSALTSAAYIPALPHTPSLNILASSLAFLWPAAQPQNA
ncbi:hypothetical protein PHLCEN_2v1985 [Hermanssonia centrifuga]|uniref:Uncharacterized protein n=1 Tax=Hermanssonia centrifuga TaxID=98765 RepID=A0A2R6RVB7_9APHY|nr:hypothetical protein PHLCEN_2v1985 [Hermanssonia centrifuga]